MSSRARGGWVSTLRRFVTTASGVERCDICAAPVMAEHQHLLELTSRRLFCACESCVRSRGDSEPFRLVVPKTVPLEDFQLTDAQWEALQLPIDLAFLFESTRDGRPVVIYPGAAGGMESSMSVEAWSNLAATNPALSDISPDVEALLINRTKGSRDYYHVSIDRCYALTGLIRQQWAGLSGGVDLWNSIDNFFSSLRSDGASQRNARSCFHG